GLRGDGRGARAPIEECKLTDRSTGAESADLTVVAFDDGSSFDDEERFPTEVALIDEDGAGLTFDLVRRSGDSLEITFGQTREKRDLGEVFEMFAARCHGGSLESHSARCS